MSERTWWWVHVAVVCAVVALVQVTWDPVGRYGDGWAILILIGVGLFVNLVIDMGRWSYQQAAQKDAKRKL